MSSLRLLAPVALLALMVWFLMTMDLAPLWQALSRVSLGPLLAGLALVQLQIWLSALRWRFTAARLGQRIALSRAIGDYYLASLLNQSLPGGMAGDALRAYRQRQAGPGGWKVPAKAVLFERLSGQVAFFLLALAGLAFWPSMIADAAPRVSPVSLALCLLLLAVICALSLAFARRFAWGSGLADDLARTFLHQRAWMVQLGLSLVIVASYGATFFIASQAVGAALPLVALVTIIPLALLAMLIPAGLGGWGTREAAAMALWPLLGATPTEGLAASLVYGALSLAGALPGLAMLLRPVRGGGA